MKPAVERILEQAERASERWGTGEDLGYSLIRVARSRDTTSTRLQGCLGSIHYLLGVPHQLNHYPSPALRPH